MGLTRRSFTDEYKEQAVALVIDGRPVVEVARNIGVHEMTLGKWVKKHKESGPDPGQGPGKVAILGVSRGDTPVRV